jgi:hypothetical protein
MSHYRGATRGHIHLVGEGVKHGYNISYYTVFGYYETLVVAQGRTVSPEPPIILTARLQTNNATQLHYVFGV